MPSERNQRGQTEFEEIKGSDQLRPIFQRPLLLFELAARVTVRVRNETAYDLADTRSRRPRERAIWNPSSRRDGRRDSTLFDRDNSIFRRLSGARTSGRSAGGALTNFGNCHRIHHTASDAVDANSLSGFRTNVQPRPAADRVAAGGVSHRIADTQPQQARRAT